MKKELLLMMAIFMAATSALFAQETVIYYPDFQYDNNKGFTKHNVTVGSGVDETKLWKRSSSKIPNANDLGYTREGSQTSISSTGYGANGTDYTPTLTYAVVDAVDLSAHAALAELKVTFFTMAQYGLGNFADFSVLVTDAYTGDPATTVWTDVTSKLDQIDDDINYDNDWTKSTLVLNDWKNATAFVMAFKYEVKNAGTVQKDAEQPNVDRPGTWRVSEVRFTGTDTPTSIGQATNDEAMFYPNPATEYITFKREVKQVELYNLGGKKVNVQLDGNSSLDVSSCLAGVYILKMELENGGAKSAKVIIK
ncbi:MAG: T9SS type A sorting domain-containing protein [Carboxylicivirga sp.]|jgi:hypothetical protein|nr:T9SS type A sorting domain-containing protein [Carboxylicivirga sp.]